MAYPKCVCCVDQALTSGPNGHTPQLKGPALAAIPDAITTAPVMQQFTVGGQTVTAPVMLPVCAACRAAQLKPLSRSGLIT